MNSSQIALLQDVILVSVFMGLADLLAKKRNRNIYLWGLAGALIIPAFILFFLPKNEKDKIT